LPYTIVYVSRSVGIEEAGGGTIAVSVSVKSSRTYGSSCGKIVRSPERRQPCKCLDQRVYSVWHDVSSWQVLSGSFLGGLCAVITVNAAVVYR